MFTMSNKNEFEPVISLNLKEIAIGTSTIMALGLLAYSFTVDNHKPLIPPTPSLTPPLTQSLIQPSAIMGKDTWVTVRNFQSISNGNFTYKPGDGCVIKTGEKITKIGENPLSGEFLVKYNAAIDHHDFGTSCADKTEFLIDPEIFKQTTAEFNKKQQQEIDEALLVENLLSKNYPRYSPEKALTEIVSHWEWVYPAPRKLTEGLSLSCGIEAGSQIQLIGEDTANNRVLARYTPQKRSLGTECSDGIIFFTTPNRFESPKSKYGQEVVLRKQIDEKVKLVINQRGRNLF